tara:strand:+ start:747 stop:971 length:225 start_codon:yes stop_codon:yes gene_type:complete
MQICGKKYMINKKESTKNISKLKSEILDLKKNILNLNFQKSSGQLEKTHNLKKAKKNIAQLKTRIGKIIGEKNA